MSGLYTYLWYGWGLIFAVIEGTAIYSRRHGSETLSELVWHFERKSWHRALFLVFWTWLTIHFIFH